MLKEKNTLPKQRVTSLFFAFFFVLSLAAIPVFAQGISYKFERMWPALAQPWYFSAPTGIAIDRESFLYLADTDNHRIVKLDRNGRVVTVWGQHGTGPEFIYPAAITIGPDDIVYVIDSFPDDRVQWFTRDGIPVGEFSVSTGLTGAVGLAVDQNGVVYVADTLTITSYSPDGTRMGSFTEDISVAEGFFAGIAIDAQGNLYVSTRSKVLVYTNVGQLVQQWDHAFSADKLGCITLGNDGLIRIVTQPSAEPQRIATYTLDGTLTGELLLDHSLRDPLGTSSLLACGGIVVDTVQGITYLVEAAASRILRLGKEGELAHFGSTRDGNSGFDVPADVAAGLDGSVYVSDSHNHRIVHFSASGELLNEWGGFGTDLGLFDQPGAIAVSPVDGSVYVRDANGDQDVVVELAQERVQHFSASGDFLGIIDTVGLRDTDYPDDLAVDTIGNVYLLLRSSIPNQIRKYSITGGLLDVWDAPEFTDYDAIAIGPDDTVYVLRNNTGIKDIATLDSTGQAVRAVDIPGITLLEDATALSVSADNRFSVSIRASNLLGFTTDRIIVLSLDGQLLDNVATFGTGAGLVNGVRGLSNDGTGRLFVADANNNRIQVFRPVEGAGGNTKAIVVAGGGPFAGNHLWDATQTMANFVYRTLTLQGFTRESIYYLSAATDLDLDGNGAADDVDADTTRTNLQEAITTWAADADDVVIYLTDHGGVNQFRISGTETVSSSELDSWLDQLQAQISGKITIIYDACESGSFVIPSAAPNRVVITSSSRNEPAYFTGQGALSFSSFFWTQVFNGRSVGEAFIAARDTVTGSPTPQTPLLDANGNGVANEQTDFTAVASQYIGSGTDFFLAAPVIGSISAPQVIDSTSTATLGAVNVSDADGIARVWAVLKPPDFSNGSVDNPVTELPTLELVETPSGSGNYTGTYSAFTTPGTYQVAIYAMDRLTNTSLPMLTTVSVGRPLTRRAVIILGGTQGDSDWPAMEKAGRATYQALKFQGYKDTEIEFLSPTAVNGVEKLATLSNVEYALASGQHSDSQDLVVYLAGPIDGDQLQLSATESLSASQLNSWLNSLQGVIPGTVTVIVEGSGSGAYANELQAVTGHEQDRIRLASTTGLGQAYFPSNGTASFSLYFWQQVANGARLREAFINARNAMSGLSAGNQQAQLDADGDGDSDKNDLSLVKQFSLGPGILLAGDAPLIGTVVSPQTLSGGGTTATLYVEDVTTTGTISRVYAVITRPAGNGIAPDPVEVDLAPVGNGRYEAVYSGFCPVAGTYPVNVFAVDTEGTLSLPAQTSVTQLSGPDAYEDDDTAERAGIIVLNDNKPQQHNFYDDSDVDWVKFYALAGVTYEIKATNFADKADVRIELYDTDGQTLLSFADDYFEGGVEPPGVSELITWTAPANGIYYIRANQEFNGYGDDTGYDLFVYRPNLPEVGVIRGLVQSDISVAALSGALVSVSLNGNPDGSALTDNNGKFILVASAGSLQLDVSATGYAGAAKAVNLAAGGEEDVNVRLTTTGTDSDGDGLVDTVDNCPAAANANQMDTDGDGMGDACDTDDDEDGVADLNDNCPFVANPDQMNLDGDNFGDACDNDDDGDTVFNINDNCPVIANLSQLDTDADGAGNACDSDDDNDGVTDDADNCPLIVNGDQLDTDMDGSGDACDGDDDGDGLPDSFENNYGFNPLDAADAGMDSDGDGLTNLQEFEYNSNPLLSDTDGDGLTDGEEVNQGRNPTVNEGAVIMIILGND